ncbi:MAG: 4Fe-4S dicluster domain-containing protein [Nitrospiraceae bacterium]
MSSLPKKNMFEIFSQGLFEGVKPMMLVRDHLVRHPDRCTHQAICMPVCPTSAWLSTPPYKFDPSRCLESCRLCLDACPSQAIYAVYRKGDKLLEPQRGNGGTWQILVPRNARTFARPSLNAQ